MTYFQHFSIQNHKIGRMDKYSNNQNSRAKMLRFKAKKFSDLLQSALYPKKFNKVKSKV